MRWFNVVREALRNHTRDDICDDMRLLGLKAEMAPRGHPEERAGSLGLITIRPGPIEWIEVREIAVEGGTDNYAVFGIADARLRDRSLAGFNVESCKARNIPLVGGFVKFSWKGNDLGLGIVDRLSGDKSITAYLTNSRDVRDVEISARANFWTISVSVVLFNRRWGHFFDERRLATKERWNCYQAIARHLLDTPIPPHP